MKYKFIELSSEARERAIEEYRKGDDYKTDYWDARRIMLVDLVWDRYTKKGEFINEED